MPSRCTANSPTCGAPAGVTPDAAARPAVVKKIAPSTPLELPIEVARIAEMVLKSAGVSRP